MAQKTTQQQERIANQATDEAKNKQDSQNQQETNVISDRVLSIVAFIITSGYILLVALDMFAEALNYDLIPLQTLIYYMAPVLLCLVAAYLFNALATFQGRSWWNLASCVMYLATIAVYPALWYLVVIQTLLTFLSFFRMHNREMKAAAQEHLTETQEAPLVDTPNEELEKRVQQISAAKIRSDKTSTDKTPSDKTPADKK